MELSNPDGLEHRASKKGLRNVQALRALAATSVILLHMQTPKNGVDLFSHPLLHIFNDFGAIGVDVFFAISGFIMVISNWEAFAKPNAGAKFFLQRVIRIYPAYWLSLIPVTLAFLLARNQVMTGHIGGKTDVLASILLYPQPVQHVLHPISWTLVFEMTFYAIFAFILTFERRYLLPTLAAWFLAQLGLWIAFGASHDPWLKYLSTALPIEFMFGALIGIAYMRRSMPLPWIALGVGITSTAALWAVTIMLGGTPFSESMGRVIVFGIPSAIVLYAVVSLELRRVIVPLWIAAVGDASYAMYLWHFPIVGAFRQIILRLHPTGRMAEIVTLAIVFGCVLAWSFAIYNVFERPVTRGLNAWAARFWAARSPRQGALVIGPVEPDRLWKRDYWPFRGRTLFARSYSTNGASSPGSPVLEPTVTVAGPRFGMNAATARPSYEHNTHVERAVEKRTATPLRTGLPAHISVEGIPVDTLPTLDSMLDRLVADIRSPAQARIFSINVHAANLAAKDARFARLMREAETMICDGVGIQLGSWLQGGPTILGRFTAAEFMVQLLDRLAAEELTVFFLGGRPGVAERALAKLALKVPHHTVLGCHHGYFFNDADLEASLIETINRLKPDVLFVGFGMPLQEFWIDDNRHRLMVRAFFPFGATLDYVSDTVPMCPAWLGKLGLHWLFRFCLEPKRMFRRYIVGNPQFVLRILRARWLSKRTSLEKT
jgi:N-acetylglucosaminyldiphosphoundecaprenol N-acetyl-beta-D-mannosaminyltransferase